ncbi:MAG TPA: UDP-3-O-(3-hydroxymyristoyl)glucosamine N-acyltransferase [Bacteroidetes bacterium]|nr:UDP-3-O-(3-hydroxymyristoyl)glucosamine N-acyltransferase [Bacteroidota bacterium]
MQITAKEIAEWLEGDLEGDAGALVDRPGKIEEGGEGTLTFLGNSKYEDFAYSTRSAVLLANKNFKPARPIAASALIRVDDVYDAIRLLLGKFGAQKPSNGQVSEKSSIHPSVQLGEAVSIGIFTVVEEGSKIGGGTILHPQVFIGENVEIGEGCILYPGVKIYHDCKIGNHCILHANVVVGGDGFGFAPQEDGTFQKIPQIGNAVIEDHVEIGANTTIDRATMGSTLIRKGAKLDNLIMVAHNVEIGANTVVAAQAGIAGSSKIGMRCRIGGQAGFVGHIEVADGTQVQAQSGVASAIKEPGRAFYGSPAIPYKNYLRSYAVFKQLPDLYKKINDLEKKLRGQ